MDPIQEAHALAQSGDLEGAVRMCRTILARQPRHDYALFMLGSIEGQLGRFAEAAKHLSEAVKVNPRSPDALTGYGRILLEQKKPAEAIDALTKALALRPQNPNALITRGQALAEAGRREEALRDFDRALESDSRSVLALHNRAHLLIQMGRHKDALPDVDALLKIDSHYVPAMLDRIAVLIADRIFVDALAAIDSALKLQPEIPELWNLRGYALYQLKRFEEALVSYEKALARDPGLAEAAINGANILMEEGRLEEALSWCDKAVKEQPRSAPAILLRANILLHLSRLREALHSYDKAVAAEPDYAEAHYHRGSALLLSGQFKEGFTDFEYRWEAQDCGFDRPKLIAPNWRGEPLEGKSIVVYSEQGLGDTIQFARFLPIIARTGAKLTFLCHPNLLRLFKPFARDIELAAHTEADRPFDFQCAMMSLPRWLGTELDAIPGKVPYVFAEEPLVTHWREKIGNHGFKIGIGWQGNPAGQIDKGRSIPLAHFAPLASAPGVRLISLQKTHGLDQLERLPLGMKVEALGTFDQGDDAFVDTAAIMQSLDLVVTSDTATPHLAGALGVPAWVALKRIPDWRWMLDRNDSPWYPSLRLFRQSAAGDWAELFARIASELCLLVETTLAARSTT
jgi:tetratricopeptide (TPR) repeat protein